MAVSDTALCPLCLRFARYYTVLLSLSPEDSEDCVHDFVLRMLCFHRAHPDKPLLPPRWYRRAAHHYVLNFVRNLRRRRAREIPHSEATVSDKGAACTALAVIEVRECLRSVLTQMAPASCVWFRLRYEQQIPLEVLAREVKITPHALEQRLYRTRKRLHTRLSEEGVQESDLREGLS